MLAHLAPLIGASASGAGTGAAATGSTLATSSSATTGVAASTTSSSATAGAGAGTATLGAKIAALAGAKALLVAAGVTTVVAVAVAAPLIRRHHPLHVPAKPVALSASLYRTSTGGSRTGGRLSGQSALGTQLTTLSKTLTHSGATPGSQSRQPRPLRSRVGARTPRAPRRRPVAPARHIHTRRAGLTVAGRVHAVQTARRNLGVRRSHLAYRAAYRHVKKSLSAPHRIAHKQTRRRQAVGKKALRQHRAARRRVTHNGAPRHSARRPARHITPRLPLRLPLSVAWPAGQILRFDQRQTLRFHTLPDASVDVTLGIVRPVEAHGLRVAGQRVYDVTMHGRADRRGYVSVPLRYAYVPTRPTPVTLTVTVHEGRRTIQRRATMMLVRR